MKKTPVKTIDCTPTWQSLVTFITMTLEDPEAKEESKKILREQVTRMAKAADLYIENQKKQKAFIVCWTIRSYTKGLKTQINRDHFEVFFDGDSNEENLKAAEDKIKELTARYEREDEPAELYTWNITEIIKTPEHYL